MVEYLPRSAWNARTPNPGPGDLTVSRVEGMVIHWPGMGDARKATQAQVASALRGWQDYHMDGRGWSDIAYQVAVDQAGRAWTLRGLRTQSGANGDNDVNERFGAILLVLGTGEHPSPAMLATTRGVIADARAIYPNCDEIKPHSAVRPEPTDCPGDIARGLIEAGAFEPTTTTTPEDDDMANAGDVLAEIQALRTEERARYTTETERWKAEADRWAVEAKRWATLFAGRVDPQDLAAAVVAKLPAGSVDQATVEAGVRAVLLDAATAE